ncbi:MAG: short-chain dehydrogenase/reductase [Modestobacter sp.]|jgi:NAD(P)-dependent dehydrogenase (short-subunit alcohol dehydrogenase family)|nr:short-chain dehydrogenase/reductase [Modestobacter sp.]MCW2578300.1 short-chain dehydrogenase/reductase [Modestobacter sp.]MCW2620346.1 short-chain dehydrogenase/reductase [Modestobacter sp.]
MTRVDDTDVPDYANMLRLDGRGVVVLGAGQGMGRQAAHALSALGARTLCVDKDVDLAQEIAREVDGVPLAADITVRDDMETIFAKAGAEFGRVDGVVDIVGLARWMNLADMDDDTWDFEFDMCLRHAFLAMQIGARAMRGTGGGAMAFVASISGLQSAPNHAAYGAAKAGLMALVRSAAVEFGAWGIRVNSVAPGATTTPRISAMLTPETRAGYESLIPTGQLNKPADIAAALLFLLSPLSANITGQTLVVDGGVTARYAFQ